MGDHIICAQDVPTDYMCPECDSRMVKNNLSGVHHCNGCGFYDPT